MIATRLWSGAYAGDDPVNFVDPSGMSLFGDILGGVEVVAGAVGIGIAIAVGGPPLLVGAGIAIGIIGVVAGEAQLLCSIGEKTFCIQ